jgi:hypothetical protein
VLSHQVIEAEAHRRPRRRDFTPLCLWVLAAVNGTATVPNLDRLVIASLAPGYVDSLPVSGTLDLCALTGIPFFVQPKKPVRGGVTLSSGTNLTLSACGISRPTVSRPVHAGQGSDAGVPGKR